MDGTSCSVTSTYSSFSSFDYKNPVIYINGNEASDYTSYTGTTLNNDVISVQAKTPSTFLTNFNQALKVAGIDTYFSSITLAANTPSPAPVIDNTTVTLSSTSDYQSVTVTGFKLSSGNGIFYGIATTDTTTVPSQYQIRKGLDGTGASVSSTNVLYTSATDTTVQMTFSKLDPVTTYMIYYYAANDDKTQYAQLTTVRYTSKTTRSAPVAVSASRVEVGFVALLVACVAGLLL